MQCNVVFYACILTSLRDIFFFCLLISFLNFYMFFLLEFKLLFLGNWLYFKLLHLFPRFWIWYTNTSNVYVNHFLELKCIVVHLWNTTVQVLSTALFWVLKCKLQASYNFQIDNATALQQQSFIHRIVKWYIVQKVDCLWKEQYSTSENRGIKYK